MTTYQFLSLLIQIGFLIIAIMGNKK
ncbi:putative holin-like toxin [Bacillus smithii]